jgi:hypothetical protein
MTDLSVSIAGVTLPNPVIPASGTWELGEDGELSASAGKRPPMPAFPAPQTGCVPRARGGH